ENAIARGDRGGEVVEREEETALDLGHRHQLEIDYRDRRQGSERADHELAHIEPGDILHHHPAGLDQLALERRELHADDEIARRAVKTPPRAARVRSHDAADRGPSGERWIERDHLAA